MIMRIAGIVNDSIVDGPGFRLTVFAQGCPHACPGCHNPQTHDFNGGYEIDTDDIIAKMPDSCPALYSKTYHKTDLDHTKMIDKFNMMKKEFELMRKEKTINHLKTSAINQPKMLTKQLKIPQKAYGLL